MLTVNRKSFLAALDVVSRVAESKSTMPVLSTVQIIPQTDGTLALSCTDLYTSCTTFVAYEGDAPSGPCAVDVKPVMARAKLLPNGHARLAWTKDKLTLADGPRSYALRAIDHEQCPPIPGGAKAHSVVTLATSTLARAIDRVLFAVSEDETRPHLNSVLWEVTAGKLRLVATDGHRLSKHEEVTTGAATETMLVPLSAMRHIRRLVDPKRTGPGATVDVSREASNLFVKVEDVTIVSRLVDAQFPPYAQVIPAKGSYARCVSVDRKALASAVKAVSVASPAKTGSITLTFQADAIAVHAEDPDEGSADESVPACRVSTAADATDFRIGVNSAYIADVCAALPSETIIVSTGGPLDPILVTANDVSTVVVVMPIRL